MAPSIIGAILGLCCGLPLPAAEITWDAPRDTAGPADVRNEGTLVFARAEGLGSGSLTVNGVGFQAAASLVGTASGLLAGGTTGSADFDALLDRLSYGAVFTLDLGSFTPGKTYLVQIFYTDQRSSFNDRVMRFGSSTGSSTVDLEADPNNAPGAPYGQFVVGTFTADGDDPDLTLDPQGFSSAHLSAIQVREVSSVPLPVLSTATDPAAGPFQVDISFTEAVSGLDESDFQITNGAVTPSSLTSTDAANYSIEVTPSVTGDVTIFLPQGSVTDLDGDGNPNPASEVLPVLYLAPGSDYPAASLSTESSMVQSAFTVDLNFTEEVTGLELGDLVVGNGFASNLTGTGASYAFTVTPYLEGEVTIDLPAGSVTDLDGDNLRNLDAETLAVSYNLPENPVVAIYGSTATSDRSFDIHLTFSEAITGLSDGDFLVVNGDASGTVSVSEDNHDTHQTPLQGRYYKSTITARKPGNVEVSLPAGTVQAAAGLLELNLASNTHVTLVSSDFGDRWTIDEASEWTAATDSQSNLNITGGFAEPTADAATFRSVVKSFDRLRQPRSVIFRQSPVWDNWTAVANVGPVGANDAQILLPVADNDYYYFGESGGAYAAWHSTDMVNWTSGGPVTATGGDNGRWTTSAEYKDGQFYILYDSPNDEDPALYIDDDVMDGVPGTNYGIVFNDPSHGSDTSLFRDDADGRFHLIYEEWSPINARKHSWDSPLAGHTSSPDGINGFEPHKHHPAVDHRTSPTGTFSTYGHPNGSYTYEVHTPEQDAYGDWTTIKIGSQYYLFGDFEPVGQSIRVGRFTSDSIYNEFQFAGAIGSGHPDPSVGFAEGRFYLVTQQSTDYTSPGPWVEGVQARAGVDVDGDGIIDQWTGWQTVSESYDHKPGYARVVERSPAQIDLSSLPAGYGFQFEFSVDDTEVSNVSPIMDAVEFVFEPGNFQKWANSNDLEATPLGDANRNGLVDLVEFAIGQTEIPSLSAAGRSLELSTTSEALAEDYTVTLWFSENLSLWKAASVELLDGVTLVESQVDANGDLIRRYSFSESLEKLFWSLSVD